MPLIPSCRNWISGKGIIEPATAAQLNSNTEDRASVCFGRTGRTWSWKSFVGTLHVYYRTSISRLWLFSRRTEAQVRVGLYGFSVFARGELHSKFRTVLPMSSLMILNRLYKQRKRARIDSPVFIIISSMGNGSSSGPVGCHNFVLCAEFYIISISLYLQPTKGRLGCRVFTLLE